VVIDACYSGTFDQQIAMRSSKPRFQRPNELSDIERFYQDFETRTSRLYLASGAKEKTPDRSVFAKRILEGLRVAAPYKGLLSLGQLYEAHLRHAQPLPIMGEFGENEAGSNFLFFQE
jgi:hypothetical protein